MEERIIIRMIEKIIIEIIEMIRDTIPFGDYRNSDNVISRIDMEKLIEKIKKYYIKPKNKEDGDSDGISR